jgi:predicted enzyme related to lactoylglutathione lyase
MRDSQRLVGVELHAARPGEAAAFYAWLLGPASGTEPATWQPVSKLFEHAVCGVHPLTPGGPPAGWVPVIAVRGLEAAGERARREGWQTVELERRHYLVDDRGIWTRLVDAHRMPLEIDPHALGNTTVEINVPTPGETLAAYGRVLDLDIVEMIDDIADLHLLLEDGVLALGGLWFEPHARVPLGPGWLVYFDVPDLELTMQRACATGVQVAVPATKEDFNIHAVLIDTCGTPFGFCTYFDVELSQMRVRRPDGEETYFGCGVQLLVEPRA